MIIALMVAAGIFYSSHWLMWAFIVWAFAGIGHPPALRDEPGVGRGRTALGLGVFALLLAIVLPWPG